MTPSAVASSSQPSRLCEQERQGTDDGSVHFRLQSNEEVMMVLKTEVTPPPHFPI